MTPEIKKEEAFSAVGYVLKPEGEIKAADNAAYWLGKDFSTVSIDDYKKLTSPDCGEIGAWVHPEDEAGELYYFFGPQVRSKDFIPEGMKAIDIPAAEYAVFTVEPAADAAALHENVKKAWKYIFAEWFDASDYKFDESKMVFELYKGEGSYVYVPVVKK